MKVFWLIGLAIFLIFCVEETKASSKIDTVYFQNGDRLTGELMTLNKGVLKLKTDDGGTINIEWKKIDSLCVLNPVRILKHNGEIFYGQMYPSGKTGMCILHNEEGKKSDIYLQTIVELIQLEKRIWDRLSGTLSAGFSFIQATNITQLDFSGNVEYKGERVIFSVNYNIILTDDGEETTQRQTGGGTFNRLLPNNWSVQGKVLAETNSEFELDLRTSLITGASYSFIRSNTQLLSTGIGVSLNRESSGDLVQDNIEALFGLNYSLFILESPKVTINFQGYLFPSLNRVGRFRSEINSDLNIELFKDFFLKGTLFYSYDNEPLSGVDVHTDWGTTLGFEYKF